MTKALHDYSIAEAGKMLRSGEVTSMALTEHALDRIKAIDPVINAFITLTRESALADAAAADAAFAKGIDKGPMQGIPHALKDIYGTAGIRTTCHSKLLLDNVPKEDCVVAAKFKAQGAVMLGKLATHEFALGGPSFDLPFPPARNPWNPAHMPGGSSSGSGAAVAAGIVRMAMGSDTGGSIRGPAGYCGTIGLKPTYGLVSRRGVFPLSYTLDHCGPLSWTVEDSAIAMQAIAGFDPLDPASADVPVPDFRSKLGHGVQGLRLGLPRHWFAKADGVSAEVVRAIDDAAQTLAKLGADIEEIELPDHEFYNACGRIILFSEAYAIHEQDFQKRPLDFGLYTYLRMSMGAYVTAADLTQALRLRRELSLAVNAKLKHCDALITASTLTPAPAFADIDPASPPNFPIQTMALDVTGNPAMSIPTGFSASGLPLSMQIVGRAFDEPTVLGIGAAFEAATSLHVRRPAFDVAKAA
jgi:aspartyl-tRNA(Asn)/glutamyl-tRNA(Gln) amidotransferase subunit A